jgi:hypothetical protein
LTSIFLSHNSKDKPWVRKLAERLTNEGINVWLDEAELKIGDSLIEKISQGINEMEYVAAIISKNSIQSNWVQKEISLAMTKEIKGRKVTVLPLLIDKCEIPESLTDKLYADFTDIQNYEAEYHKLLRSIDFVPSQSKKTISPADFRAHPNRQSSDPEIQIINIKIVGIVNDRTRQDSEYSGLQDYYLQLSSRPPADWVHFFDESRDFARHSMWRDAWIEDDCVVVKCALAELEKYHITDLKQDVETANKKYWGYKNRERQLQKELLQQEEKKRMERDNVLNNIKFD